MHLDIFSSTLLFAFLFFGKILGTTYPIIMMTHGSQPGVCQDPELESPFLVTSVRFDVTNRTSVRFSQHVKWRGWTGQSAWQAD